MKRLPCTNSHTQRYKTWPQILTGITKMPSSHTCPEVSSSCNPLFHDHLMHFVWFLLAYQVTEGWKVHWPSTNRLKTTESSKQCLYERRYELFSFLFSLVKDISYWMLPSELPFWWPLPKEQINCPSFMSSKETGDSLCGDSPCSWEAPSDWQKGTEPGSWLCSAWPSPPCGWSCLCWKQTDQSRRN